MTTSMIQYERFNSLPFVQLSITPSLCSPWSRWCPSHTAVSTPIPLLSAHSLWTRGNIHTTKYLDISHEKLYLLGESCLAGEPILCAGNFGGCSCDCCACCGPPPYCCCPYPCCCCCCGKPPYPPPKFCCPGGPDGKGGNPPGPNPPCPNALGSGIIPIPP